MINNLLEYPEHNLFRAVTGATSVFPNAIKGIPVSMAPFPTKGTLPLARTMTGTLLTAGVIVRGTGTLFEDEFKPGDFVYNNDKAVRKILSIQSNIMMTLEATFTVDVIVAIAALKCEAQVFKVMQIESVGTAAAELQEAPFPIGSRVITWGAPIAYDASATNAQLAITISK